MAEVIYTTPNMARNTQGEREERIVEIYATSESLGDQHQDYVGTEESSNTLRTVRSQQPDPVSPPRCQIRGVVVLLVLLSFAILAAVVRFAAYIMLAFRASEIYTRNKWGQRRPPCPWEQKAVSSRTL